MNFGSTPVIGRHIIDIDGCLKSTDLTSLTPREVAALIGASSGEVQVFVERYDDLVPLASNERVPLSQETVQFFRTLPTIEYASARLEARSGRRAFALAA